MCTCGKWKRTHQRSMPMSSLKNTAWDRLEQIKAKLKTQIGAEFGINHSTLEFERTGACDAEAPTVRS